MESLHKFSSNIVKRKLEVILPHHHYKKMFNYTHIVSAINIRGTSKETNIILSICDATTLTIEQNQK
jgi:hypothetical protein